MRISNDSIKTFSTLYKKHFHGGPLQRRLIYITTAFILIVCMIVSVISFYIFRNYLKDGMVDANTISILILSENIDTQVNEVYRLVRYCQSSSDISEYMREVPNTNSAKTISIYDRFTEKYQDNEASKYIARALVVSGNNYLQVCQAIFSTSMHLSSEIPKLNFYEQLLTANNYDYSVGLIEDPFLNVSRVKVIPIIRPIIYKYNSDQLGYTYLEFTENLLTDQLRKFHSEAESMLYIVMGDHTYSYSDGTLTEIVPDFSLADIEHFKTRNGIRISEYKVNSDKYTLLVSDLCMTGCYVVEAMPDSMLQSERWVFLLLFGIVLFSVIALGILMSVSFNRFMYIPLNKIRRKIALTATGDFTRDSSIEWNHELGEIGRGINDLSESVNQLMENRLADEKKKRDLEYQMLQSQINPHFLYNTLNSIKMMAQVQGATGISEMTTSLASLLRSISKGTSLIIPISEELSLVKDYFTIQNYRYGGMIEYKVNIENPEIENSKIIKFTLQPLVENAIFHGLEPKGGIGTITLNLFSRDEETICIEVTDNGVGMSPEQASKLLEENDKKSTDFFKEIGISNVNKRLQYEFGEKYGISVESVPGEYTTMRVLLPK